MDNSMISIFFTVLNLIVIIWFIYDSYRKDKLIYRLQKFNEKLVKDNDSLSESLYYGRWESGQHEKKIEQLEEDLRCQDLYIESLKKNQKPSVVKEFIKSQRPKTTSSLNDLKK